MFSVLVEGVKRMARRQYMEPLLSTQAYLKEKYKASKDKRITEAIDNMGSVEDESAYDAKRMEMEQCVEGDLE